MIEERVIVARVRPEGLFYAHTINKDGSLGDCIGIFDSDKLRDIMNLVFPKED